MVPIVSIPKPYLIFLGDAPDAITAKTGFGLRDWARADVLGQWRLPGCRVSLDIPDMAPDEAAARGAGSVVIGIAPAGGGLPAHWILPLRAAMQAGLDVVAGLHTSLVDTPALAAEAGRLGRRLIDVRRPPADIPVATGRKRRGRRLLTVGTDCALGKKYTALAITRALRAAGVVARFVATGQTGLLIAGEGIAIDAVVADFAAGAAEALTPDAPDAAWAVIEGQGSLFHPAYAGVSLALLHGSQPDAFVVCHDPARTHLDGLPHVPVPSIEAVIEMTARLGRVTNPAIRCVGVSLNTTALEPAAGRAAIAETAARLGLPCFDPLRSDLAAIAAALAG